MDAKTLPNAYEEYDPLKRPLSLDGLVKNTLVGFSEGLVFGAIGKYTGADFLPVIIPSWDLLDYHSNPMKSFIQVREEMPTHNERVVFYIAFGAGVSTAYAGKIYPLAKDFINKL